MLIFSIFCCCLHILIFIGPYLNLADTFHEVKSKREKKKEVCNFELEKVGQIRQICLHHMSHMPHKTLN